MCVCVVWGLGWWWWGAAGGAATHPASYPSLEWEVYGVWGMVAELVPCTSRVSCYDVTSDRHLRLATTAAPPLDVIETPQPRLCCRPSPRVMWFTRAKLDSQRALLPP